MTLKNMVSFDIDGVLNYYPNCWIEYINIKLNSSFKTKEECLKIIGEQHYNKIKDEYRKSDYKANLIARESMVQIINKLNDLDFSIVIITSRPILDKLNYPELEVLTKNWLDKNGIIYDELIYKFDHDRIDRLLNGLYISHIDDDISHGVFFANRKIPTLILGENRNCFNEFICCINNYDEIIPHILRIKGNQCDNNR